MKHIKKKFFLQTGPNASINSDTTEKYFSIDNGFDPVVLKKNKDQLVILHTEENFLIGSAIHDIDGKTFILPLPDLSLIYFNSAQHSFSQIDTIKKDLLTKFDLKRPLTETAINELYLYYHHTCGFVIFLFTAIETFINQLINKDDEFIISTSKRKEVYDSSQIQEFIDFKTKITKVIPKIIGKNFFTHSTPLNEHIWNLKEFRDSIIHAKKMDEILPYNHIVKKSLSFNYNKALEATAKFMNFYKPDYIEKCDCGEDF